MLTCGAAMFTAAVRKVILIWEKKSRQLVVTAVPPALPQKKSANVF